MQDIFTMFNAWNKTITAQVDINKYFTEGFNTYNNEFLRPLLTATEVFNNLTTMSFYARCSPPRKSSTTSNRQKSGSEHHLKMSIPI